MRAYRLGDDDLGLERACDVFGNLVLDSENILQIPIVALGPKMAAALAVDQLCRDPHRVAGAPEAAFEYVADAEIVRHVTNIHRLAPELVGRVAGDHEQVGEARDVGDDVLGQPVGEVFLIRIPRQVLERQHRDRRLVGKPERHLVDRGGFHVRRPGLPPREPARGDDDDERSRNGRYAPPPRDARPAARRDRYLAPDDSERRHRLGDILDRLRADVLEAGRQLVLDLIEGAARDADAVGLGQAFQPRGHVDPVAEQLVALNHHVADVDADAQAHPAVLGQLGVADPELFLDRDGAAHRLHRAGELGQHAVAAGAEHPAVMPDDQAVDNFPIGLEGSKRRLFIGRHQPRVALDIGGEDCRKPSLDTLRGHDDRSLPDACGRQCTAACRASPFMPNRGSVSV